MAYKKPILKELYAEVYYQPGSLNADAILEVIPTLRRDDAFQTEFVLAQTQKALDVAVVPRVRLWNSNRTKLVQLSDDLVVVNIVINQKGNYLGWSDFRKFFDSVINHIDRFSTKYVSVSLNPIDDFDVPKEGYHAGKYLKCDGKFIPRYYDKSTNAIDLTIGDSLVPSDGKNRQIRVAVRMKDADVNIRIHSVFHDRIEGQNVYDALEGIHVESNTVFESLITDRTRQDVMEGRK